MMNDEGSVHTSSSTSTSGRAASRMGNTLNRQATAASAGLFRSNSSTGSRPSAATTAPVNNNAPPQPQPGTAGLFRSNSSSTGSRPSATTTAHVNNAPPQPQLATAASPPMTPAHRMLSDPPAPAFYEPLPPLMPAAPLQQTLAQAAEQNVATVPDTRLVYPRDFFKKNGGVRTDPDDVKLFFPYRKNRQSDVARGRAVPDSSFTPADMIKEMTEIRTSLKEFVKKRYFHFCRARATQYEALRCAISGQEPCLEEDFRTALKNLPLTPANELMVYDVFLRFQRDCNWVAAQIDEWAKSANIKIMDQQRTENQRLYRDDRGGFTPVAGSGKSTAVDSLMLPMFRSAKWCIRTRNQGTKDLTYTQKPVPGGTKGENYYLVTPKSDTETVCQSLCCGEFLDVVYRYSSLTVSFLLPLPHLFSVSILTRGTGRTNYLLC